MESRANTPFWQDKSLYAAVLGFLLPILNQKFGLGLNSEEVVGALAPIVAFIAGNKWKSGHITAAEVAAAAQASAGIATPEDADKFLKGK